MNSKWQINRVGLIDFWYYDEQEFYFQDGRMLLRGANGSGKSVTMQSFLPLLLDGNMRPERLDPFGSRARKMENYLLDENDDREERIGYLYMELKRPESDQYASVGIGMRARKNKKLDSWYFGITDGRRIGQDIFLYKDMLAKISCTKLELKNRIGEGGRVMETQTEYAQYVNRLLFGFETMDEYREMMDLLIQLRTPKLSKDFKPTIINDILSSSLQTLSEDDLRPMSEAIENMDTLKSNLDQLSESVRAARQIERGYDQYNLAILYEKAVHYTDSCKAAEELEQKQSRLEEEHRKCLEERDKAAQQYNELCQEEEVLQKEKNSLSDSDAAKLKEQEEKLSSALADLEADRREKEKQKEKKEERRRDTEQAIQAQQEKNDSQWMQTEEFLEEMETELEDVPFDEADFLKQEILDKPEEAPAFESHRKLLQAYQSKVADGCRILEEEARIRDRHEALLQELDERRKKQDQAEREANQYQTLLHETKDEQTERICRWEKENRELKPGNDILSLMARKIAEYSFGEDYSEIRRLAEPLYYERSSTLREELREKSAFLREKEQELQNLREELRTWQEQKDPEPELSEEQKENRARLNALGISYLELYRCVEFADISAAQASRLEEALLHMGLLDALIVPAEERERILTLEPASADRYIFSDLPSVRQNLLEWLEIDNKENDILFYQKVSKVLSSIEVSSASNESSCGNTWIDDSGHYRLGVLEGTSSGAYEARFIGTAARERFRQKKIEELKNLANELSEEIITIKESIAALKDRLQQLEQEWDNFPDERDLKVAAKEYADRLYTLERIQVGVREQTARTEEARKALDAVRLQVSQICAAAYLPARLDGFRAAKESLEHYSHLLSELRVCHESYRNGRRQLRMQKELLEDIDRDLDDIRYDWNRTKQKIRETEQSLEAVRRQLAMTDYEEIKERLDACILRLRQIPGERETAVKTQAARNTEAENIARQQEETAETCLQVHARTVRLAKVFDEEYRLGYASTDVPAANDSKTLAVKVRRALAGQVSGKKTADLAGNLQGIYHENRAALLEYNLTVQRLFEDLDTEEFPDVSAARIDITAKYRGSNLNFKELLLRLSEDMEEQTRLLGDKDRELFEDILANTISKKIRARIQSSQRWVEQMNTLMGAMQTSSGLRLSLKWKKRRAETEDQLDTGALVDLLQKDAEIMREEEVEKLSRHFRSKIEEARKLSDDIGTVQSFHAVMKEVLDYRKWFEFQLECQKTGEKKKELTDRVFFTFSGGEKAMSMYVPLFSAVVAKYAGARPDAPRLISLDEAFAGVDEMNIRDMFRLMTEFEFNFMINSQVLWGDCDTVPALAIYQLVRPENARYVTVIAYQWNGKVRTLVTDGQ